MAEADQSNADLPSALGNAASVPALPAPLGNDPVSREIEALPAILHRSGANARFAAHEFFLGAIRNENTLVDVLPIKSRRTLSFKRAGFQIGQPFGLVISGRIDGLDFNGNESEQFTGSIDMRQNPIDKIGPHFAAHVFRTARQAQFLAPALPKYNDAELLRSASREACFCARIAGAPTFNRS